MFLLARKANPLKKSIYKNYQAILMAKLVDE